MIGFIKIFMPAAFAAKGKVKPFSIQNFRELYNRSEAKKYLSAMDIEQIRVAMEKKDTALLEKLYETLLKEQASNDEIVRDFVITKNKILDEFYVEATQIKKRYVEAPMKKRAAKAEQKERKKAEDILKQL